MHTRINARTKNTLNGFKGKPIHIATPNIRATIDKPLINDSIFFFLISFVFLLKIVKIIVNIPQAIA